MIRGDKLAEFLYGRWSTRKTGSAVERSVNFHVKLRRRRGRLLRSTEERDIGGKKSGSVTRIFLIRQSR